MLECYYFHTFLIQYHLHLNPIPEVMESKRTGRRTDIRVITFLIFTLALILILVESCKKDNLPPNIIEFSSDVQQADWGDVINLHVVANDPEQEALSYLWQISGGTLLSDPSKRNVQWEMPNSDGTFTYTVEVRDAENIVSKSDSIQVISNPELVIVGSQELDFGTDRDSIHVFLANEGTGDLEWSILESELNIEWLESITPQSGKIHKGESQEVVIQINRTGQSNGIYTGIIKIESGGGAKNLNISMEVVTIPTVITTTVTGITSNTAIGGGDVIDDGGAIVTARGVCWSADQKPTTSDRKTIDGSGEGSFTSSLTDLTDNTRYYIRSYATNCVGTSYGILKNFTTMEGVTIPTVITTTITGITTRIAKGGGDVTDDGGATVTARGVCWSTSLNPTTSNRNTNDGTGEGSFTSSLTALSDNTRYYVRSYATNSAGTGYGSQRNFKTLEEENGEWIQYDDNSFEYYAKTGDTGRLFMRFSMPTGWQSAKMTKVMISLSSSFSPFDIEVCDEYILTNDNIKLPSQNLSKVRLSLSQSSGWRTHIVDQDLTSPEFFILLYSNSDDGPRVLADVDHPDNFYRCGTIIGNEIATWSTVCLAIRIYLEEITEPISNPDLNTNTHQDNSSQGVWLEVNLMELLEKGNVKKLSNSELAKQKK